VSCPSLVKSREFDHPQSSTSPSPTVIPDLPNSRRDKKTLRLVPKAKGDTPKILELMGKADILGMVTYDNDILLVYEGQHLSICVIVI